MAAAAPSKSSSDGMEYLSSGEETDDSAVLLTIIRTSDATKKEVSLALLHWNYGRVRGFG
jgi:hypothetical protein